MNSIKLAAILALCVAGQALAVSNSAVSYTLELGGNNNAAAWKNGGNCDDTLNPPFTSGGTADGLTVTSNVVTWAAQVAVTGVHNDNPVRGGTNFVFSLELRSGSATGPLVVSYGLGSDTTGGYFSTINNGVTGLRQTNCGAAADPVEAAAFAVSFSADTDLPQYQGRMIDLPNGGPHLDFFQYPAVLGHPADGTCVSNLCSGGPRNGLACTGDAQCEGSNAASGTLQGVGAGYSKFSGYGCPGACNGTGGTNTAGVGLTAAVTTCGLALGQGPIVEGQLNLSGLDNGTYVLVLKPGTGNNVLDSTDCNETALGKSAVKQDAAPSAGGDTILFTKGGEGCGFFGRTIAGRHIFYNNSNWDGNNAAAQATIAGAANDDEDARATDKVALLPTAGVAVFANHISYNKGITGIMVDIASFADCPAPSLTAADFVFKAGNTNTPGTWAAAPPPSSVTVTEDGGVGGSDRVTIIWPTLGQPGAAVANHNWLQVTVLPNGNTGLFSPDVHYWGLAVGEANSAGAGPLANRWVVNATDELNCRNNQSVAPNSVPVTNIYDFNRSRSVNATDQLIPRNNTVNNATALLKIDP